MAKKLPTHKSSHHGSSPSKPSLSKKEKHFKDRKSTLSIPALDVLEQDDESSKKGTALAYAVLSKEDSEQLLGMSALEMESKLQETFQLSPATDLKDASILDYYVGATYWAKQQNFSAQQLSGVFTVVHTLLQKIKDDKADVVNLLMEFRKMLVGVGTDLTGSAESGGIEFFNVKEAKAVTDYIQSSILQHYRLYEFMFTSPQWEEIIGSDLSIEIPIPANAPFPPPLDEGISETTFNEFLSIRTPSIAQDSPEGSRPGGQEEEAKAATPVQVDLPGQVEDLFAKLTPEDIRSIIQEVSSEVLENLQTGVEGKMRTQENAVLTRINKIHNILPQPHEAEVTPR